MTKNRLGLVAAWLLATALAMGVASQAVGLVADRAVGIPAQVPIAVAGQSSFGPISAPPSAQPTTTTSRADPPTTTTAPSTSATPTTSGSPASVVTTTTIPPATTTTTEPAPLDSGTFFVEGGQVSASCMSASSIRLDGAVPVAGWSLKVESSGPEKVRVDFESGERESEVEITCESGRLRAKISD